MALRKTFARRPIALKAMMMLRSRTVQAVFALGITQIIAWGTTLYALGILADPIILETGWSRTSVFGGLTVSLLASAAVSPWIGRLIDRFGARKIMTAGSIAVATGLVCLSQARSELSYLGAWLMLGPAMRMTLYDAAFAALVQITPARSRTAISYLTLFGGFASTLFWPIGHGLAGEIGWRMTLLVFAAINITICLPLHWWGLARGAQAATIYNGAEEKNVAVAVSDYGSVQPVQRRRAMLLFAIVLFASGFILGAVAVHLVNLIGAGGLAMGVAVYIASLRGIAQVAGRIGDIIFARNLNPVLLARFSVGLLAVAFILLLAGGASFQVALAFTIILGVGQGLFTIVRGTVPLILFGSRGYGEVLGVLGVPYWLANALAPALFALIIDRWGYPVAEYVLLGCAAIALLALQILTRWLARDGADRSGGTKSPVATDDRHGSKRLT